MQKSSKNDYLSIDYFLDDSLIDRVAKALHIRNRIGKIVKNLEDISGTSQMKIPVTYPSGSKYLYSIFSSEDVYAVLREDWEGVIFQILLGNPHEREKLWCWTLRLNQLVGFDITDLHKASRGREQIFNLIGFSFVL